MRKGGFERLANVQGLRRLLFPKAAVGQCIVDLLGGLILNQSVKKYRSASEATSKQEVPFPVQAQALSVPCDEG